MWIAVENLAQNAVGHAAYGRYAAYLALTFMFTPLLDLGIGQYCTKTIAARPEIGKELLSRASPLRLALIPLYALAVGVVCVQAPSETRSVLLWTAAINLCAAFLVYFRALLQAYQRFTVDGWASSLDKLLLVACLTPFLWNGNLTLTAFLSLSLLTGALTAAVFGAFSLGALRRQDLFLHKKDVLELLRKSLPFAFVAVLYGANERINQVLLTEIAGESANGLYSGAYRWFSAASMYLWTVLPVFYAKFSAGIADAPETQARLFARGQTIVAAPVLFVCGVLFVFAEKAFMLFTQSALNEIATMATCLRILTVALALNAVFNVYSTYLTATGYERKINWLLVGALSLNALTTVVLAQTTASPTAAAWGLLASFSFLAGGYVYYYQKYAVSAVPARLLGKLLLFAAPGWATLYFLRDANFFSATAAAALVTLLAAAVLRLHDVK